MLGIYLSGTIVFLQLKLLLCDIDDCIVLNTFFVSKELVTAKYLKQANILLAVIRHAIDGATNKN